MLGVSSLSPFKFFQMSMSLLYPVRAGTGRLRCIQHSSACHQIESHPALMGSSLFGLEISEIGPGA